MENARYPAGTLDLQIIKNSIYDWIAALTEGIVAPTQIIWRNQSEALPARPCVTMKIIDGPRPTDRAGSLFFNGKCDPFNVGEQLEMTVSIQIFGNTKIHRPMAMQLGFDLNSSLTRQSILDKLKRGGVSIQGRGQPRNLTALEETEYEERSGFEISCGLVQNVSDQPGIIETVNLSFESDGETIDREITLP